jgi:hypothetical protein
MDNYDNTSCLIEICLTHCRIEAVRASTEQLKRERKKQQQVTSDFWSTIAQSRTHTPSCGLNGEQWHGSAASPGSQNGRAQARAWLVAGRITLESPKVVGDVDGRRRKPIQNGRRKDLIRPPESDGLRLREIFYTIEPAP